MEINRLYEKKNNIFQSPVWAEFQKAVGKEPLKIEGDYFYKGHLIWNKNYLYSPKGTVNKFLFSDFRFPINNSVFIRIEPPLLSSLYYNNNGTDKNLSWKPVTKNSILSQQYSPKQTLVLDLTKTEEEILLNMKSKFRYNIKLAKKKGLKIRQGISKKDIDSFYNLSLETSERDSSYSPYPKNYYEKMVKVIGESNNLQIFTAEYKGKPLSSLIVLFFNETAIYLHGASSSIRRELMPNHLTQWEAIREAKRRKCKYYDFWGISLRQLTTNKKQLTKEREDNWTIDENHPWAGITRFKMGFVKLGVTGEVVEFPGAYDLPINKFWYNGLSALNWIRKHIAR